MFERGKYFTEAIERKECTPMTVNERNVQGDSCAAYARGRFIHQRKPMQRLAVTLIRPFWTTTEIFQRLASGDRSHAICRSTTTLARDGYTSVTPTACRRSRCMQYRDFADTCFIIFNLSGNAFSEFARDIRPRIAI